MASDGRRRLNGASLDFEDLLRAVAGNDQPTTCCQILSGQFAFLAGQKSYTLTVEMPVNGYVVMVLRVARDREKENMKGPSISDRRASSQAKTRRAKDFKKHPCHVANHDIFQIVDNSQ
jgi:hypothetical protein